MKVRRYGTESSGILIVEPDDPPIETAKDDAEAMEPKPKRLVLTPEEVRKEKG